MQEIHLEPWEKISDELQKWLPIIEKKKYPEIPEEPELGKVCRMYPAGCLSGNGTRFHGNLRLGKDPGKLLIFFNGGGVSWNEYTAARPNNLFTSHLPDSYYFNTTDWMGDYPLNNSIFAVREDNPFQEWTIINIPYSTGDFHCGAGDFPYIALDDTRRTLPHHGYLNTIVLLRMAKRWVKSPETLLIAGVSAGGFGVSLMAEDVISEFPECADITCVVDSSLLLKEDWSRVAREIWHSPEHIWKRLTGDNITLDSYSALYQKFGSRVKYLFASSTRDALLVQAQNALYGKGQLYDKASGLRYQSTLKEMCNKLVELIPTAGLYIFEHPMNEPEYHEAELTMHCILDSAHMFEHREEGKTACEWIMSALHGRVERIGLGHL
ncbi:hypothetical protein E2R58_09365 [Paenibacillus amylolyticus]|uniref:pectin acetylesterase-family hydrolase n=1 Tax=Paenibacillus amylolyticus TaxID=1451 RepID=UPI0010596BDE|nr:pectin acetylesterase-family hydrolase [Paenibacillus amylolyticus]TDL69359.1 hypothetical protein E2R58_09365 [Paenibacillus amylolyticus]